MENETVAILPALEQTLSLLWQEAAQLEGENLKDLWTDFVRRLEENQSARISWLLILVLVASGCVFAVSVSIALFEGITGSRRTPKSSSVSPETRLNDNKASDDSDQKLTDAIAWADKVAPSSVIEILRSGDIPAAEKALISARQKKPKDVGIVLYLLACRAMKVDAKAYDALVSELFPDGLDAEDEGSRHAAELGRLVSTDSHPGYKIPPPNSVFDVEAKLIGDTLGQIAEFGNIKTLLDLVRMDIELGDVNRASHLLVEVLVRGSEAERKMALNYVKIMKNNK